MPSEQRANSSAIFLVKYGLYLAPEPSAWTPDSLTQKHSNVQDNSDVTKAEVQFHFFHYTVRPIWKRFREAIGCLRTFNFFTLFLGSEEKYA